MKTGHYSYRLVMTIGEGWDRRATGSQVAEWRQAVLQGAHADRLREVEVDICCMLKGQRAGESQGRGHMRRCGCNAASGSIASGRVSNARCHSRVVLPLLQGDAVSVESSFDGDAVGGRMGGRRGDAKLLQSRKVTCDGRAC